MVSTLMETLTNGIADELELDAKWEEFSQKALKHEREFRQIFNGKGDTKGIWERMQEDVIRRLYQNPPRPRGLKAPDDEWESWMFRPEEWAYRMEREARPVMEASMAEGAAGMIADIQSAVNVSVEFDVTNPRVVELIDDKVHKFSFNVNKTTTDLLREQFKAGLAEGEGIPQLRKRVEEVFGFSEKVRTERIARTESIGTVNKGNYEVMVISDVVKEKSWLATRDDRTRDSHIMIDGEVVPLKSRFSNGLLHPGDWDGPPEETINCRCTMLAESFKNV
jgi:SPP1 gp7 family putative phage head morphogenesis protein